MIRSDIFLKEREVLIKGARLYQVRDHVLFIILSQDLAQNLTLR